MWFSKISESIIDRAKDNAKYAVLQLWNDRMITETDMEKSMASEGKLEEMPLYEQPFVTAPNARSTIGDLLISFGGFGLVLGGVLGGVHGMTAKHRKKNKAARK
jgi:hypothetical protein